MILESKVSKNTFFKSSRYAKGILPPKLVSDIQRKVTPSQTTIL
jgi:hypothetical protein